MEGDEVLTLRHSFFWLLLQVYRLLFELEADIDGKIKLNLSKHCELKQIKTCTVGLVFIH